jgi:hypothetical protein
MVRPNLPALELHTILNHRLTSSHRNNCNALERQSHIVFLEPDEHEIVADH